MLQCVSKNVFHGCHSVVVVVVVVVDAVTAAVLQCVSKNVFRGLITMVRALVAGLEHTYQSRGPGGMASTMMILEIMHTHYWEKEGSSRSDTSNQSLVVYSTSFNSGPVAIPI